MKQIFILCTLILLFIQNPYAKTTGGDELKINFDCPDELLPNQVYKFAGSIIKDVGEPLVADLNFKFEGIADSAIIVDSLFTSHGVTNRFGNNIFIQVPSFTGDTITFCFWLRFTEEATIDVIGNLFSNIENLSTSCSFEVTAANYDLQLTKSQSQDSLIFCSVQDTIQQTYTLVVYNDGVYDAPSVVIKDQVSTNFLFDLTDLPQGCILTEADEITCTIELLQAQQSDTFEIKGYFLGNNGDGMEINLASIVHHPYDTILSNDTTEVVAYLHVDTTSVEIDFDCQIPDPLCPGGIINLTGTIRNTGPDVITDAHFLILTGLESENIESTLGIISQNMGNSYLVIDEFLPNTQANIMATGTAGAVNSSLSISGVYGACNKEINYNGCEYQLSVCADLILQKTTQKDTLCELDYLTYSLKLTNDGPHTAKFPQLIDIFPKEVFIDGTTIDEACETSIFADSAMLCTFPDLEPQQSVTITFSGIILDTGTITNCATATSNSVDENIENNEDCAIIESIDISAIVKEKLLEYIQTQYPERIRESTNIYLCTDFRTENITIASFDNSQFTKTLAPNQHFGWADWDSGLRYEHPVTYFFLSPKGDTIHVFDNNTWWPTAVEDSTFNAFATEYIILEASTLKKEIPQTLHEEGNGSRQDSICALVIEGYDKRLSMRNGFAADATRFIDEITKEKSGPNINPENVVRRKYIGKDSLNKLIAEQKEKCKKIYFYYSGHGTPFGIFQSKNAAEFMPFQELLSNLDGMLADQYCLIFDACYSGAVNDVLRNSTIMSHSSVEIYSSSSFEMTSTTVPAGEGLYCENYGLFSANLFNCWGDPAAEKDGIPGIDLCEAWQWFAKIDTPENQFFKTYNEKYMPVKYIKVPSITLENGMPLFFPGIELELETGNDCPEIRDVPLYIDEKITLDTVNPEDMEDKVFDVSNWRTWTLEPMENIPCDSINAILRLFINPFWDKLDGAEGVLGPVTREDANDKWRPHYPFVYNPDDESILVQNIKHFSQWAVGMVEDQPTSVIKVTQSNQTNFYPNPISTIGTLEFEDRVSERLKIQIVDFRGRILQEIWNDFTPGGKFNIKFDLSTLPNGTYWILIEGKRTELISILKLN